MLALLLLVALQARAQELPQPQPPSTTDKPTAQLPASSPQKPAVSYALPKHLRPERPVALWQWDDALLLGSFVADEVSTRAALTNCSGCREANPMRNTGVRLGYKAASFALVKWFESKHPRDRQKSKWLKVAISGVFAAVATRNIKLAR